VCIFKELQTMIIRTSFYFTALCGLLTLNSSASAQKIIIPKRSLHFIGAGTIQQINKDKGYYSSISLDLSPHKKQPVWSFYIEMGNGPTVTYIYGTSSSFLPNPAITLYKDTLETFDGRGISATWHVSRPVQLGIGLGRYAADSQRSAIHETGLGGRLFMRVGSQGALFYEAAILFPVTRRYTTIQTGVGVRF
jgi:hypothetical protein